MSVIKKLAGQTAIYGLSSIVGRLLNYLLVPLHTYFFTTSEYGVISEFYAYVAFLVVFLMFGMETTFFRFVNGAKDKEKTFNQAFSIVLSINVVFLGTVLLFAQPIASWMMYPEHANYVIWFAFILAFDALSAVLLAKLRFQNKAKKFALIQLSSIGVTIILNLFFLFVLLPIYPEFGIGFIFIANLFASLIKPLFLWKEIKAIRLVWDKFLVRTMVIFALPMVIAGFAGIVNETIDRILLKRLLIDKGVEYAQSQVGIYSANYKLSIIITLFIQAFRYAAEPFFFAQEHNKDKAKIYSTVMTYFVIVVSLIFLGVTLYLDIFKWFINERYWEGLKVVPILLMANIFLGIYYNQSIWYKLANKTKFGAYIAIGGAIITLSLNILFIPHFGYVGSAWATLIVYFLMMLASHFLGQKYYPIKYNLRKVLTFIIVAWLLYLLSRLVQFDNGILQYGFRTILLFVFVGVVFFIENPLKLLQK
ncbi:polysaccharide biosynthesis protein [Putridiphycobacter roseus]|uniref:Polysaccharide biosynthesis protein n=1 Tax=Putridiphycobacter roseus TaxID=2219161 RepID=A0A2W1NC46_9FLAO|nr:polysaccharide biosynthesis C-terminal domain-containing protein [Putridiphycobacter roseus]PZE16653.1 polysaccharide biosynthesis protein [Putridiphycobacter roseus]